MTPREWIVVYVWGYLVGVIGTGTKSQQLGEPHWKDAVAALFWPVIMPALIFGRILQ